LRLLRILHIFYRATDLISLMDAFRCLWAGTLLLKIGPGFAPGRPAIFSRGARLRLACEDLGPVFGQVRGRICLPGAICS